MKPYFEDERAGIAIYHGRAEEIALRLQRFDLLLTDPPYGIGRDGSRPSTSSHGGRKAYEFLGWDDERPDTATIAMLLQRCDKHIIWGGNYFVESLTPSMKWLVWDKGQWIDQSDGELAWTSLDGALRIFTLNRVALMQDGAVHPTQKPERLMRWCIQQAGEGVRSVVDPYMGSGTTLRAAKDLGISAVGIETQESYCEIAARRLSQDVLPFVTRPVAEGA